jgi:hypothetical protein
MNDITGRIEYSHKSPYHPCNIKALQGFCYDSQSLACEAFGTPIVAKDERFCGCRWVCDCDVFENNLREKQFIDNFEV